MMGNLHEWTADPAGTFRGGFYVDTKVERPGLPVRDDGAQHAALGLFDGIPMLRGLALMGLALCFAKDP